MAFFQTGSLANIDALFQTIQNCLTSSGWTALVVNSSSSPPELREGVGSATSRGTAARETIFRCNGTSVDPTRWYLSMVRTTDSDDSSPKIVFSVFAGIKNYETTCSIASISRHPTNGVAQVTCSSAHNLVAKDRFIINGNADAGYNLMWDVPGAAGGQADINPSLDCIVESVSSPTAFTFRSLLENGSSPLSSGGGLVVGVYNVGSSRCSTADGSTDTGLGLTVSDSTMALYMYYDAFRFTGMIVQGGVYQPFYVGETNRDHIPDEYKSRAFTTSDVGTGSVTINLDRSSPNIFGGQNIWLVHPSGTAGTGSVERVAVISKLSPTSFTCVVSSSDGFPSGSFVGEDPIPACVIANLGDSAAGTNLASSTARFIFHLNGTLATSATGSTFTPFVETGMTEANIDPDNAGYFIGRDIFTSRAAFPAGVRGKLVGVVAFPRGSQNDLDIMRVGPTPVNDDYKLFVSRTVDGTWCHALGGGAQ